MLQKILFVLLFCDKLATFTAQNNYVSTSSNNNLRRNLKIEIVDPFIDELKQNHSQQLATLNYFIENGVCQHFYWDMGTNIGIQLRKLYEPQHYPGAPVLPFFATHFGPENPSGKTHDNVCAIGFEPNHIHISRLIALQDSYQKAGYPLVILTSTAVWNENGQLTFYDDVSTKKENHQWGSSLVNWGGGNMDKSIALSIDIDQLIHHVMYSWDKERYSNYNPTRDLKVDPFAHHNEELLVRSLPHFHATNHNNQNKHHPHQNHGDPLDGMKASSGGKHYFNPKISKMIAKVDIEGAEFTILPHMALHGSICFFDEMMIEWHYGFVTKDLSDSIMQFMKMLENKINNCRFHIDNLDDESYGKGDDNRPFPEPIIHHANTSAPELRRNLEDIEDQDHATDTQNHQKRKINKILKTNVKYIRLIRLKK
jgi:hypothetical protein